MSVATYQAPVLCRNRTPLGGPTVISSDPKSTHEVIFGSPGAQDGSDVQPVPEELLRTPQFAKAISTGVLEVVSGEDNPLIVAALKAQNDSFQRRASADKDKALLVLDQSPDNDMIAVQCIGPGTRPDTRCENTIPLRVREKDAAPPLCNLHASLAMNCVRRGNGPWTLES